MPERQKRVLLVDDDAFFSLCVSDMLGVDGVDVIAVGSVGEARKLELSSFDAIILDDLLPDGRGLELFPLLGAQRIIVISADPTIDMAIAAVRHHAVDFLTKPIDLQRLRRSVWGCDPTRELIGHSRVMHELREHLLGFAHTNAPLLLRGETGTGKTRIARTLHDNGPRASRPFVSVNCGALPESLIESELFGSERGAFTGAREARRGLLEAADSGTFFLDEIAELPLACQAKLLDVIESKTLRRVGSVELRRIDIRFMAATHVDLDLAVERGRFRQDLLYRLDVLSASIPPLREQLDGLPSLIHEILHELESSRCLAEGELEKLAEHDWPGNIRELRNLLYRATVLQRAGRLEPSKLLPRRIGSATATATATATQPSDSPESATVKQIALQHMLDVARTSATRKQAAAVLGIAESTLRRKLKQATHLGLRSVGSGG